jgi:hypothetical protein
VIYNQQFDVPYTAIATGFGYETQLNRFPVGIAQIPVAYSSLSGSSTCRQEIAVVVDGTWLTDPVSGQHNFKLDMSAQR